VLSPLGRQPALNDLSPEGNVQLQGEPRTCGVSVSPVHGGCRDSCLPSVAVKLKVDVVVFETFLVEVMIVVVRDRASCAHISSYKGRWEITLKAGGILSPIQLGCLNIASPMTLLTFEKLPVTLTIVPSIT